MKLALAFKRLKSHFKTCSKPGLKKKPTKTPISIWNVSLALILILSRFLATSCLSLTSSSSCDFFFQDQRGFWRGELSKMYVCIILRNRRFRKDLWLSPWLPKRMWPEDLLQEGRCPPGDSSVTGTGAGTREEHGKAWKFLSASRSVCVAQQTSVCQTFTLSQLPVSCLPCPGTPPLSPAPAPCLGWHISRHACLWSPHRWAVKFHLLLLICSMSI